MDELSKQILAGTLGEGIVQIGLNEGALTFTSNQKVATIK